MEKNYQVVFTKKSCVELCEVPYPNAPAKNEVLIRTIVSQISTGTELTMLEANVDDNSPWHENIVFPNYPGYSNVGEIIATGEGVSDELIGKKVLTLENHVKYTTAEVGDNFHIIPDGVSDDDAVFGVIAQITMASIRSACIKPGETAVVYGAGLIGQLVARFAKIAGAINVIVADVSDYRLSMIPDDNCIIGVNTKNQNIQDVIRNANDGRLADVVFETTGNQSLLAAELECVEANGKLIVTSSPKGSSLVNFDYCSRKGITIISAHNFAMHTSQATNLNRWTRKADSEYFLKLAAKKQIDVKNMITHRENYKNAADMYNMLMKDRTGALAVHLYWED